MSSKYFVFCFNCWFKSNISYIVILCDYIFPLKTLKENIMKIMITLIFEAILYHIMQSYLTIRIARTANSTRTANHFMLASHGLMSYALLLAFICRQFISIREGLQRFYCVWHLVISSFNIVYYNVFVYYVIAWLYKSSNAASWFFVIKGNDCATLTCINSNQCNSVAGGDLRYCDFAIIVW